MRRSFPSLFRYVALLLVVTVMTSGMAMAAYVCPAIAANTMSTQMMDGMPCAGLDMEKPVHCAELAADTKASLDHHNVAPALAQLSPTMLVRIVLLPSTPVVVLFWPGYIPQPDPDPPYLRTIRIRV